MATPLQYPSDWPKIIKRHFLLGIPVVGAQVPVYRELCEHSLRVPRNVWRQWGDSEKRLELAQFLAQDTSGRAPRRTVRS